MGTYMNSTFKIIEVVEEVLNGIEGDFSNQQLLDALEVMKLYPAVCDKMKSGVRYTKAKNKFASLGDKE